jgi:FHA domain
MPVTGTNLNQRPTDAAGSAIASHPGAGGSSRRPNNIERGNPGTLTPTFLERHGHTPMNLSAQVYATQNTATHQRPPESPPAPILALATVAADAPPQAQSSATPSGKISIRIVPAMDSFTRIPLRFDPIDRKVDEGEMLVVGRHTDRLVSEHPTAIVFRSKVVSRNHAKIWYSNRQWYLQDVGSSSGTFLNHIRLSSPNVESPPCPIKDGDIVQLGIDFRVLTSLNARF